MVVWVLFTRITQRGSMADSSSSCMAECIIGFRNIVSEVELTSSTVIDICKIFANVCAHHLPLH